VKVERARVERKEVKIILEVDIEFTRKKKI
jgi:hypothetical protein